MSQDHQGYQQQEVHHDLRYHMHQAVIPNTSSSALTHGTGPAATNGSSSSFQTPGGSVSSNPYTPPVGDQSRVSSFSSSNQHTPVAAPVRSSSLETWPMGHGQSKPTPPRASIPPQFLTSGTDPVLDGLTTTGGINVSGKRLKRAFGAKSKESNDSHSVASKEAIGEAITVSKSSSSFSPPTGLTPDSNILTALPPPSRVLDKYPVTLSSNPTSLSQPAASFHGPTMTSSPGIHPKSSPSTLGTPAAAGNRSSVIALSPGISSAINFMMMEWQEPSRPQLVVDTSSAAVSISPSLPSGDGESSKANKDNESQKEMETLRRHSGGSAPTSPDRREMKESWRKSDSTNSHHTVRANSLRASRPVSWAESFHSAYTIVPANGTTALQGPSARRLSGLLADVDFGVREEELEEDVDGNVENSSPLPSHQFSTFRSIRDPNMGGNLGPLTHIAPSPAPYRKSKDLKKANRRSISLSSALPGPMASLLPSAKPLQPGPPVATTTPVPAFPSPSDARKVSYSISGMDSFRNASQPYVQTHLRQQSENLLHQRPPVPLHSADVTHHVPSIVFSTSQLTSDSRSMQDNIQQPSPISRGRLHALLPPLPRNEQGVPAVPPESLNSPSDTFRHAQTPVFPSNSSHLRQPAISGLGPSAAGIAKRAVERMTKRFGDMMNGLSSSSNSSISGHSSSTSISTSASTSVTSASLIPSPLMDNNIRQSQFQGAPAFVPGRIVSRGENPASPVSRQGSGHAHHQSLIHGFLPGPSRSGGHKRFQKSLGSSSAMGDIATTGASSSALSSASSSSSNPPAASSYNQSFDHDVRPSVSHGAVSVPSSSTYYTLRSTARGDFHPASTSQSDPFSPTGPILGRRLRGPLKKGHVFGRELRLAAKETKVVTKDNDDAVDAVEGSPPRKVGLIKTLECRMLPAVVTRCAQHLLIWGVQEEGLFRVNGGPRHVSHLRAEFDSGADYDMTECSPGELDPHAVASVFKAYLRELPDSILTHQLQPYFDAAINKENSLHTYGQQPKSQQPSKSHQGLPMSPRNITPDSLRKPPSLSTLAMPSFNQVPPPSKSLINAFRSLIAQLPPENRDLIRTVVDLIKATAKGSKATKMPLSNLLLLFCPSLNLSPPLLRLLCEAEGIWEEERITSMSRGAEKVGSDGAVFIHSRQHTGTRDEDETDSRSGFDEESSLRSGRTSSDNPSSLDYHASAEEDSLFSEEQAALQRRDLPDRPKIPTVYLDTQSHLSSSSVSLSQDDPETYRRTESFLVRQEVPDDGSISSGPYSIKNDNLPTSPSLPLLCSSADSVSSRTSSANPSFSDLPLDGDKDPEPQKRSDADLPSVTARASPHIFGTESTEIRKRPLISNPIPITGPLPFPTSRNREQPPTTPSRRRSIPLLSLSSLSSRSNGSPSPSPLSKNSPYLAESRTKKTSLKLLFSKKSSSSLFEGKERPVISLPFLQPPGPHFQQERASPRSASGSDSSVSTPLSAVTAPQGSGFFFLPSGSHEGPPVLNTLIEDSSLKFDELMMPDDKPAKGVVDTPSPALTGLSSPTTAPTSRSVLDPVSHSNAQLSNLPRT